MCCTSFHSILVELENKKKAEYDSGFNPTYIIKYNVKLPNKNGCFGGNMKFFIKYFCI
jgi:hypothetical protein